jgi:hypothetical protein
MVEDDGEGCGIQTIGECGFKLAAQVLDGGVCTFFTDDLHMLAASSCALLLKLRLAHRLLRLHGECRLVGDEEFRFYLLGCRGLI